MIKGYNSRELLACIDGEATLAVEIGVAHAVGVVVASVGVALSGEAVLRVGTTAVVGLTDVVLVLSARVRGEREGVGVGLPVVQGLDRHVASPSSGIRAYQTSISAQQAPNLPTPALASLEDATQPSRLA